MPLTNMITRSSNKEKVDIVSLEVENEWSPTVFIYIIDLLIDEWADSFSENSQV